MQQEKPDLLKPHEGTPRQAAELDEIELARDYLRQVQTSAAVCRIQRAIEAQGVVLSRQELDRLVPGSPGDPNNFDSKNQQQALELIAAMLSDACKKVGCNLRGGIVSGVVWEDCFEVSQRPVAFTDAGMVVVRHHFLVLCHLLAKALALSVPISDEGDKIGLPLVAERILDHVRTNPPLVSYWEQIIRFFATLDRVYAPPLLSVEGQTQRSYLDFLFAAEVFVMAHEYGHHIEEHANVESAGAGYQSTTSNDRHREEFAADHIATLLCRVVGGQTLKPQNFFLMAGVGGVIVLCMMEMIYAARRLLQSGDY